MPAKISGSLTSPDEFADLGSKLSIRSLPAVWVVNRENFSGRLAVKPIYPTYGAGILILLQQTRDALPDRWIA
jgi:hypothetical protein